MLAFSPTRRAGRRYWDYWRTRAVDAFKRYKLNLLRGQDEEESTIRYHMGATHPHPLIKCGNVYAIGSPYDLRLENIYKPNESPNQALTNRYNLLLEWDLCDSFHLIIFFFGKKKQ